jgi:hypothetical protein
MNASVKKMVLATGMETAIKFFDIPLTKKFHPNSLCSDRIASTSPRLVLNISLRITSRGFVRAAPATPAADDLIAE